MKLRLKYTGLFVSFFVVIAFAIILFTVYILTANKRIFSEKVLFHTSFENSIGLSEGAPVFFKGFKIGFIEDFYLDDKNKVITNFYIFKEYVNKIANRSVIIKSVHPITSVSNIEIILLPDGIISPSNYYQILSSDFYQGKKLLSENNLSITGADKLSYIVNNLNSVLIDVNNIIAKDSAANNRSISQVLNSGLAILEQTEKLLKMLNGTETNPGELLLSFKNFSKTSAELIKTSQLMNKTLYSMDTLTNAYKNPEGLLAKMVDPTGENIVNPTTKVLCELQVLLSEHEKFANYLNSKSSEISILLQKLDFTLIKLNTTLEGINNNPLISSGISEEKVKIPLIYSPLK